MQGQRNDRKRYSAQWQRMFNLIECTRNWRNLSAPVKAAWSAFATAFPQPTKRNPDKYLTGYQLFIKRNYYQFLHEGPQASFITDPVLTVLNEPEYSVMINADGECIDVTELYIKRFGILPEAGQFVIVRIIPISQVGGAFFSPLIATVEVDQVYIDGLFLSFFFSSYYEEVEFSIYLSKPVWESVQYPGTKFRYMGCFKPTKFIQLTDTPDSYVGEAGKVVAVKDDETGVEFIEAGGGGIDCDDLAGCSLVQQIIDQLNYLSDYVSSENDTSIPPINYGLLYNYYAKESPLEISSSTDWVVLTRSQWIALVNSMGGNSNWGGYAKETGLTYWNSPNTGADNSLLLNFRGAGVRKGLDGAFSDLNVWLTLWNERNDNNQCGVRFNSAGFSYSQGYSSPVTSGISIRLARLASPHSNGESGMYVGNNGRIYRTITQGGIELMADNLAETKFRDGSSIPEITNAAAWAALTTPAFCAYNNDWANV
jgi:hypothetical protein